MTITSLIMILLYALFYITLGNDLCGTPAEPRSCAPSLMLLGEKVKEIDVTSECGRYRDVDLCNGKGVCERCNITSRHPASNLIDQRDPTNQTCWVSDRVEANVAVNITIPLNKRFEIFYIAMEPCMDSLESFPDSIAIYKSWDFQKTWQPWHYFSKDCQKVFHLPTSDDHAMYELLKVYCSSLRPTIYPEANRVARNSSPQRRHLFGGYRNKLSRTVTFSTSIGRQINQWSSLLNNWMSATDVRISIFKHTDASNRKRSISFNKVNDQGRLEAGEYMAMSDIKIAGRCQCNGHASECLSSLVDGKVKFACDCKHNTEGQDCEKCSVSFMDRPWTRATPNNPEMCKKCECNLHSDRCRFSNSKYTASKRVSGGVCENCQHNTAGDNCERCADGFYRDWSKPASHKDVCLPCNCSPNGSLTTKTCNSTSGQCLCKDGVTGQYCNRCLEGFNFTNNSQQPCLANVHMVPVQHAQTNPCPACIQTKERINLRRFCNKAIYFVGIVNDITIVGEMVQLEVIINAIWKINPNQHQTSPYWPNWSYALSMTNGTDHFTPSLSSMDMVKTNPAVVPIWLTLKDYRCACPASQLGQHYLFGLNTMSHFNQATGRQEFMLNQGSLVIPWRGAWVERLNQFRYRYNQGLCNDLTRLPRGHRKRGLFRRMKNIQANNYYNGQMQFGNANYYRYRRRTSP